MDVVGEVERVERMEMVERVEMLGEPTTNWRQRK